MILVIEDHEDTRNALVKFLSDRDINTLGVGDGEEALKVMKSKIPFLVLIDWHIPSKSGLEVLCEMQKDSRLRDTHTIFYTADSDPSLKQAALKAGARKVLIKGNDWEDLINEIADLTSVSPERYQD